MAGLDAAIHALLAIDEVKTWITGSSPVMTIAGVVTACVTLTFRFNFQTATIKQPRQIVLAPSRELIP
jgi:hypothetical protein